MLGFVLFKEQGMLLSLYPHWCHVLCFSASSQETKMHRNHTWHAVLRQPLHFISNRQFSMFTSSLSAWETLMEKSQGGNGILSLRVTTAAWFNETVCQKAKQQPVNKQAEVAYTHTHTRGMCAGEQHNSDGLSKTHRSLFFTRTNTKAKKRQHACPKSFWQELRQAEMKTAALRAHREESAVKKTHIAGSAPLPREEMSASNTLATSSDTGVIRAVWRRSCQTKYYCHLRRSHGMKSNPNKCNEWFTKYLPD